MKTSAFIATLLTFLLVILVLGAAVFFLWQAQQLLKNDVAGLATRKHPVKILGNGELSKKLNVRAHAFSATAREKIEAAGGSVEVIE